MYSLPQAPFQPGTVISSAAVNSDLSDIAIALTGSVAANGVTPITGQLQSTITATPAYSSNADLTTGFGSRFPGVANIWAAGTVQVTVTASAITLGQSTTVNGNLNVTGALTAGSVSFSGNGAIEIPSGTTAQRPGFPTGSITNAGSGGTNGTYTNAALTGGSGSGGTATIVVSGNSVVTITPTGGLGYQAGDILSTSAIPGLTNFAYTIANASAAIGDIRYNTTTGNFEGFDGTEWQVMSNITTDYSITASVGSGILTVNILNAKTGAAPTISDPLAIKFRDNTLANGDQVVALATGALSINTNAIGATLGSSNSTPFRFWLVSFNNGGTVVLALINCSTNTQIFPLVEYQKQSSTGMSVASTSAGVFYTPNGVTVSNVPFKILGYLEYSSGLGTAGNYTAVPTQIQLFGPGIKKPGEVVQLVYGGLSSSQTATNSGTFQITNTVLSITPTSTPNLILARALGFLVTSIQANVEAIAILARSSAASSPSNTFGNQAVSFTSSTNAIGAAATLEGLDAPGTTSSTQYSVYLRQNGSSINVGWLGDNSSSSMTLMELMG